LTLISGEYLALQKKLHERGSYGVSSGRRAGEVSNIARNSDARTILDYGCGKGFLARALRSEIALPVAEYDPAIPGKDKPPAPADLVVCTDVLEHIEPEFLEENLKDLARCLKKVGYFVIHTKPAHKVLADGRNAHLIQEGEGWWRERLELHFRIKAMLFRDDELQVHVAKKR
jgi:predicted TPR repeat methyltransferase